MFLYHKRYPFLDPYGNGSALTKPYNIIYSINNVSLYRMHVCLRHGVVYRISVGTDRANQFSLGRGGGGGEGEGRKNQTIKKGKCGTSRFRPEMERFLTPLIKYNFNQWRG